MTFDSKIYAHMDRQLMWEKDIYKKNISIKTVYYTEWLAEWCTAYGFSMVASVGEQLSAICIVECVFLQQLN